MDVQVENEMVSRSSHKVVSEEVSAKAVVTTQVIKQSSVTSEQSAATAIQGTQGLISEISALRLADSDDANPHTNFSTNLVVGGENGRQQASTASESSSSSISTMSSVVQKELGSCVVVEGEELASSTSSSNENEVHVTVMKPKAEIVTVEDVSEDGDTKIVVVKKREDNVDIVAVVEVEASKSLTETDLTEEVALKKSDSGEVTQTTTTGVVVDKNVAPEDQSQTTTSTSKTTTVTAVVMKSEENPEENTSQTVEKDIVFFANRALLADEEKETTEMVEEVQKVLSKETQVVEEQEEEGVYEEEESDEVEVVEEQNDQKLIVEVKELKQKELKTVASVPQGEDGVDKPKEQSPSTKSSGQPKDEVQQKQDNIQNSIKEIISDIDSNINEENIAILKQQQMELLKQQQDLAQQIRQQQQLAQQLAAENAKRQQQLQQQQQLSKEYQLPQKNISKYSSYEENKDDAGGYTCKSETFESSESSNVSKKVDLHKIFTPATDAEEIVPKNRKLYSSSAFYSPSLHPTVEDQVELARRISHSLSDTNNQKSKGQSMYVNRKKRSVKWVHEGSGQDVNDNVPDLDEEGKENTDETKHVEQLPYKKLPLRLLMNPRGQLRDIHSEQDAMNFQTGLLSPDKCAEVVNDLQAMKGRDLYQYQPRPPTSPSIVPAYSDAGKHRVQLNIHQEQLLEKYGKPELKVVKTPWEAALETGSASAAFVEDRKPSPYQTTDPRLSPLVAPHYQDTHIMGGLPQMLPTSFIPEVAPISYDHPYNQPQTMSKAQSSAGKTRSFLQRDLAYKPNVAQGWKAPTVSLPKDLYVPKDIPFGSYAPPPEINLKPISGQMNYMQSPSPSMTSAPTPTPQPYKPGFPVNKPGVGGFGGGITPSAQPSYPPPKQQQWAPTSYQKVSQMTSQNVTPVNFNPSPLPYDKLAKFENPEPSNNNNYGNYSVPASHHLNPCGVVGSNVRNLSPTPYGRSQPSVSPKPTHDQLSSPTGYVEYNNNNRSNINNNYGSITKTAQIPMISHLSKNDLMHGQTFNNSARGWKSSTSFPTNDSARHHLRSQMANSIPMTTTSLPYTDF